MSMLSRSVTIAGLALAAVVLVLSGGCAPPVASLSVQAFIVTKGKENVRLGLLSVNASPESAVCEPLQEVVRQMRQADARLQKQLIEVSDQCDLDVATREKVRLELANTEKELELKRNLLSDLGRAEAEMTKLASLEGPGFREAIAALSDRISRKSDEALQSAQRLRAERDRVQADAEFAKAMALNDTLIGMRQLTEKRIEGKSPIDVMLNEFTAFYSRDVFGEFEQERATVLKFINAAAAALQADKKDDLRRKQDDLRLAVNALENSKVRLTQDELTLAAAIGRSDDEVREIRKSIDAAWSRDQFFAALPPPEISKKTDPNGLVAFELDRRKRWVFWAKTERQTPDTIEKYYWIVGAPPSSEWSKEEPMFLSNDNLLEPRKAPEILSE